MNQFCPDTPLGILSGWHLASQIFQKFVRMSVRGLLLAQICPDKCIWLFFDFILGQFVQLVSTSSVQNSSK